jgi:hypothetical protein
MDGFGTLALAPSMVTSSARSTFVYDKFVMVFGTSAGAAAKVRTVSS